MSVFERTRDEGCLSDLALDRLLAGERVDHAREHLLGCAACAARKAALERDKAAFAEVRRRKGAPIRWAPFTAAFAAAAAVLLVVFTRPHDDPGNRTKGTSRLGFY